MKRLCLILVLCFVACVTNAADKQKIPHESIFEPLLGKRVTLDALAWHGNSKSLYGEGRVVLPSGEFVCVRTKDKTPVADLPQGKLVRSVGILTFEHVPAMAPRVAGPSRAFSWFVLELESFTVIERVERGFPELSPK